MVHTVTTNFNRENSTDSDSDEIWLWVEHLEAPTEQTDDTSSQ